MSARAVVPGLAAAALALLTGCAALLPVAAPGRPPTSAPATTPPVATSAPAPRPAPAPSHAALDTTAVSPAGRAVVESLPEPLAPGERVPAPTRDEALAAHAATGAGVSAPAPATSADSLRLALPAPAAARFAAAGTDSVPVPAPTQPLGDKPGTLERLLAPDTSTVASAPASASPAPPAASPPAPAPAATRGCWRVQVAAPADRARADALRAAAESQLLVPFVVEHEKKLYKVRTKACVDGDAAESLKRRASLAGFTGVFKFAGGPR